ncbi:hypothetical protein [Clavibacter zhangzhiyongii]|uniref:hypothetical protein n=1 Tax=Clavibacter zhangzhiyongii TaxID=2768071 RepID=UPI0039E1D224
MRLAETLVEVARVRRDAGTALAGPVATGRTVLLLPGAGCSSWRPASASTRCGS